MACSAEPSAQKCAGRAAAVLAPIGSPTSRQLNSSYPALHPGIRPKESVVFEHPRWPHLVAPIQEVALQYPAPSKMSLHGVASRTSPGGLNFRMDSSPPR